MAAKTTDKAVRSAATTKKAAKSAGVVTEKKPKKATEKKLKKAASDAARTELTATKAGKKGAKAAAVVRSTAKPDKRGKKAATKTRQKSAAPRSGVAAPETLVMAEMAERGLVAEAAFREMAVSPLPRPDTGQHLCLGIVAGSDAPGSLGCRPIGDLATDLCEIAPSGQVAIAGDTFSGDCALGPRAAWYASLALHVKPGSLQRTVEFDGTFGWNDDLYDQPHGPGRGESQLPAGTIQVRVGGRTRDYLLVTRTQSKTVNGETILEPISSRLVVIDPERPRWRTVPGSERPAHWQWFNQTQISGFQDDDGWVYIVADSFSRDKPVVLYHCHAETFEDRNTWWAWAAVPDHPELPWLWDQPRVPPTPLSDDHFGELSLRKIEGKYVLSGFNKKTANVEVRVANDVTQVLAGPRDGYPGTPVTTVVTQKEIPHCYGGYIAPGSTLNQARILVSQWGTEETKDYPYTVREYVVNLNRLP